MDQTINIQLAELVSRQFDWQEWERCIRRNGYTLDRPYRSIHPLYPEIIYPIDYGFINGTTSTDGAEIDLFVGSVESGLVGMMITHDHRKGDRECKLIYNGTPEEIYLVHGFINFDPRLMNGLLFLRRPMRELWPAG